MTKFVWIIHNIKHKFLLICLLDTNCECLNPRCIKQQSDLTDTKQTIALKGHRLPQSLCAIHSNIWTTQPVSTKLGMNGIFHKPVQSCSCSRCQNANCCTPAAGQQFYIRRRRQQDVQFCPTFDRLQGYWAAGMFVTSAWLCIRKVGVHRERNTGLIVGGGLMCN